MQKWKVKDLIDEYRKSDEFKAKAFNTQKVYESNMQRLHEAFGLVPADKVDVYLIRQYIKKRTKKMAANREVSMLQTIYKWAMNEGMYRGINPCVGVIRNPEKPRNRYVEDDEYRAAWEKAPYWLQDAMDIALLTGQRIGDVLSLTRQDIRSGHLWITQAKTGTRVAIQVSGEFQSVLERILARPRAVSSMYLIAGDDGQRVRYRQAYAAFQKCGATWQFRDIRAKAGSDMYDAHGVKEAQQLLGHRSQQTTESVYIRVRGKSVKPLR